MYRLFARVSLSCIPVVAIPSSIRYMQLRRWRDGTRMEVQVLRDTGGTPISSKVQE